MSNPKVKSGINYSYQPTLYPYDNKIFNQTTSELTFKDIYGGWLARWGINRHNYAVKSGLYALGNPDSNSSVLVTANYKLTFDKLRAELSGLSVWLLVLNTAGVNVWCAAGKGTLSTKQLIGKIKQHNLDKIVNHKKIILPQLAAVGVAAHEVTQATGFKIIYGPVRAADIKQFLADDCKKTAEMSRVSFNFSDRLAVVPVEIMLSWKYLIGLIILAALSAFFTLGAFQESALREIVIFVGAAFTGIVLVPALLPYLPFRAFVLKGAFAGIVWLAVTGWIFDFGILQIVANICLLTPLTAFLAMNFTGASTYTSQSGTTLEVQKAFKPLIVSAGLGIVLKIISLIVR